MIIYEATKGEFVEHVKKRIITDKILEQYQEKIGNTSPSEIDSWRNSLKDMRDVLEYDAISEDTRVAIEFQVPNTSKRVDFLISGLDEEQRENVVIIELKQWQKIKKTQKDGVVITRFRGGERETTHPSYQAWSYASLIREFNQTVQEDTINLFSCAFLHNYRIKKNDPLTDPFYKEHIEKAPIFSERDIEKLSEFISKHVRYPDDGTVLYRIENGKIKPSKNLAEAVGSMLRGNTEFHMIDEQKTVYEELRFLAEKAEDRQKRSVPDKDVVIIKGGPGTGKSVIAINLLAGLVQKRINARYITRNSAPRAVYSALLKGEFKKSYIDNLFNGSGSYVNASTNEFSTLIVDEAHRLNEKSGMFSNKGENQTKEIINAAQLSIFFIDEAQTVTLKDKGFIGEIKEWADYHDANVYELELYSQFRCNGSDGYLAWLDDVLGIRETANKTLDTNEFDFRVFDDPNELRDVIFEKNKERNKARLLAGYCWNWEKDKRDDTNHFDITIPEHDFGMSWNLGKDGQQWLIQPSSVHEIGCIHTSQGLELDYIGVIIGDDLRYENGRVITDVSQRARTDQSVKGWKKGMKENPEYMEKRVDEIIRNTYRTLLTRGLKGCYVYCTDRKLSEYIKQKIGE